MHVSLRARTHKEGTSMVRPRRFTQQIFQLRTITIDRTQVRRQEDGHVLSETRQVMAVEVFPSPARGVERYQYIPIDPANAHAELARHLRQMYGIGVHQLVVRA